jgi:L-ascorbate metabolism protein UlaG (beta-lactamase superfamily)
MKPIGTSWIVAVLLTASIGSAAEKEFEVDVIKVDSNDLKITFIGHGTLMFQYQGKVIHVDPVSREADYTKLPKADLILITHEHGDHLDPKALGLIRTEQTKVVLAQVCAERAGGGLVMKNGDVQTVAVGANEDALSLKIEAVPAYNIVHTRSGNQPYHPKGVGNGYVVNFGKMRVYIAGDTENTSEMKALKNIDIAFLPMNVPFTMTPEMVADAARAFKPRILYPYHYAQTDPNELVKLLEDDKDIEVRIRQMQ